MNEEKNSFAGDVALVVNNLPEHEVCSFVANRCCDDCPKFVRGACLRYNGGKNAELEFYPATVCWEAWQEAAAKIRKKDKEHEK